MLSGFCDLRHSKYTIFDTDTSTNHTRSNDTV